MTFTPISLSRLKTIKNTVIGNPSAKVQLAQDELFVQTLVQCLNEPPPTDRGKEDIRIEAAHVISSISYGSDLVLGTLLRSDAPRAFLYAISKFGPEDEVPLRSAFARGLRALAIAIAETVGPSQWGLREDKSAIKNDAEAASDYLFQTESLDLYLPLLVDTSPQTRNSIAQLIGFGVRTAEHRKAVTEWLPLEDRLKEVKTKRGWEKTATTNANAPSRQGGWVARNLTKLLHSRDTKLQEAALWGLAAMSKDNARIASVLSKPLSDRDGPPTLSFVLSLAKTRSTDIQLAACLCATNVIRASTMSHPASVPSADDTSARTVMNVLNRIISTPSETLQNRTKACFVLYYLVTDNAALAFSAFERGCLAKLAALVQGITPLETRTDWEEDESDSVAALREASLTAIAAISLFDNTIRRNVTDDLRLLPTLLISLSHRHVGIRYAACQCVRALSRAVAVLRTNIVDSGLGIAVFQIFKKEGEDRRVTAAALAAVCNIVNEFSPLRPIYLDLGLMPRLVQVLGCGDPTLRLSALWAVKNLLRKTSGETKRDVMNHLGWQRLAELLEDQDEGVQEQAFSVIRNLAENEQGIDMIFRELGSDVLLRHLTASLAAVDDDVVLQATYVLANLANGCEAHQDLILAHPQILASLRACLAECKPDIRRPAVSCILELARTNPKRRRALMDAGIVSTLRHICHPAGPPGAIASSTSPGGRTFVLTAMDDDRDVIEQARTALDWLEHGEAYR
ncbi:armadillo-type protein [Mycena sp. CBHHK59/15]|nr:armadillo-type protein [Mycena sp. CBHHK59/15]